MEAYLNQNFYGNQSYGVQAAATSYFGKDLDGADASPSTRSSPRSRSRRPSSTSCGTPIRECTVDGRGGRGVPGRQPRRPGGHRGRHPPQPGPGAHEDPRSVLSGKDHTAAEYEAAKTEPVILAAQVADHVEGAALRVAGPPRSSARILCGERTPTVREGGHGRLPGHHDARLEDAADRREVDVRRRPRHPTSRTRPRSGTLGIPKPDCAWLRDLRGHNIHNGAAGVMDYRTGEVLAYAGSGQLHAKGNKKFQPQFDVLFDGWRQPGSAIKPMNYVIGIDDQTLTASTMFMDVVTDFGRAAARRSCRPRRTASSAVPCACATRSSSRSTSRPSRPASSTASTTCSSATKDFGLSYPPGRPRSSSQSIGTLEIHPIDLISAYGTIANGGVLMPRHDDPRGARRPSGRQVWPAEGDKPAGKRGRQRQAAYIMTDILAGQHDQVRQPVLGRVADHRRRRQRGPARPRYKTGTTDDNQDVHAYGYLAPPEDPKTPGPRRRRLDGQLGQRRPTTASCRSNRRRRCGRGS